MIDWLNKNLIQLCSLGLMIFGIVVLLIYPLDEDRQLFASGFVFTGMILGMIGEKLKN